MRIRNSFGKKEFSTDEVNRYLYDAESCSSVEEANEWIQFYINGRPKIQCVWIVICNETGEKIGTCGFHCLNKKSVEVDNVASWGLAQKLGFVRTGEKYNELFRGQEYLHDIYRLDMNRS